MIIHVIIDRLTMWTESTETLFEQWLKDFRTQKSRSKKLYLFWKFMSYLYIPIAVVSWIFGSKGLIEENKNSKTGDIVLLSIGVATVVLDRLKPKKYKLLYKTHTEVYNKIIQRMELQLALPRSQRKSTEDLIYKIQVELKVMNLKATESVPYQNDELEEIMVE